MIFDKSKVYTAINADDSLIGSEGFFADTLDMLEQRVRSGNDVDIKTLESINSGCLVTTCANFNFFYLIDVTEKKYRPFKSVNELYITYESKRIEAYGGSIQHAVVEKPCIWVKLKSTPNEFMITSFERDKITVNNFFCDMKYLYDNYTFLDDSPCGICE